MPGAHAEPVPGRYQGCSSPLCPVGESAPFSCPISPELASKRQFPALSMGKLAPFPTPSAPNWRQSGSFPLCLVCESAPFPASSAPNWHQSSSFPLCPVCELAPCPRSRQLGTGVRAAVCLPGAWAVTRTACHTLSGALSCEILPFFPALSLSCVKNARCILSKNSPVRPVLLHQL